TDSGGTWTALNNPDFTNQAYSYGSGTASQGWYDLTIAVDPTNANHILAGGIALVESPDTSAMTPTWTNVNGQTFFGVGTNKLHPDQHALVFTNGKIIVGDDGGVFDYDPSGPTVTNSNGNLNITQFYFGFNAVSGTVLAGAQDNASARTSSGTVGPWTGIFAGDGGPSAITPNDTMLQFIEAGGSLQRTTDAFATTRTDITPTSSRLFTPPMIVIPNAGTPSTPTVLYGGFDLFRTTNPADPTPAWSQVTSVMDFVSAIAVDPSNPSIVYVGFKGGTIEVSTDNGATFNPLATQPFTQHFITGLSVDPTNPKAITASVSSNDTRFSVAAPHVAQYVYTSTPGGGTWTVITGNLPTTAAVSRVVYDGGSLVAATDRGVWGTSTPAGSSTVWTTVGTGLPAVQVQDLYVATDALYAATHGRGVWKLPVAPVGATHFVLSAPSSATAGTAFNFTVTAQDASNATATGYTGTVHFSSTDGQAVLPADSTLTNGTGTFSATLKTAGSQTITGTDTMTSSITGTSNTITVAPGAATHYVVSAPSSAISGTAFNFTTTALDAFNNTATGYGGTVHFTSSDVAMGVALPANSTLTNGTGTFAATLKTAGGQTITGTDTVTSSITGTSNSITVAPGAATHLALSAPMSATSGAAFNFTVTAKDAANNTATGYGGTVHFTTTDASHTLPANSTLTNGTGTFMATLNTAGNQTITGTDTTTSSITGTSNTIAVGAGGATHLVLSTPSSATAGTGFSFTVTAEDVANNVATGYGGTVHFTSTDAQASLPANSTLTNGVGTFMATLKTAGNRTITGTDTTTSSIAGTSNTITVGPAAATHLSLSAPSNASPGVAFNFTTTALDQFNNTATGYSGTVHWTTTDASHTLPANSTLMNGTITLSATLNTVGNQTITGTDTVTSSITGTSNTINVSSGPPATHFLVQTPASATAGSPFSFSVTAEDASNATVTNYGGTIHFTSSDMQALLPPNSTLTNGTGTFMGTFKTAGGQSLTATDTVTSSIFGSDTTTVSPAAASRFSIFTPSAVAAGSPFNFTTTAQDPFGNTATSYGGTVIFSSSDMQAVLPPNSNLINGTITLSATLKTAGNQTITATDTVNSSIHGTSPNISVSPAATSFFDVFLPLTDTAGSAVNATVTAEDAFDNTTPGYGGTVHFTSTDGQAVLPANSTLTMGQGMFSVTFKTAGNQTITGTDTVNSSITGTSNTITVSPAAATHLLLVAPASATINTPFNFTTTAKDAFNNTATGYGGTVHFTSTDAAMGVVLPGNSTLTNGTGTFSATLKTVGTQTITGTDTMTSSITGTSGPINVTNAPPTASHFLVSLPSTVHPGQAFNFSVTALSAANSTVTNYPGTIHFTSSDTGIGMHLPPDATLTNGTGTFSATLVTTGTQSITATDTVNSSVTGTGTTTVSSGFGGGPGPATHYTVSAPSAATTNSPFSFSVTALDASNAIATGYTGTVHFISSVAMAVLPP
ncbi:MAG: beta strand repeat-containing protein, partial [Acidimicrobiales bacterium]